MAFNRGNVNLGNQFSHAAAVAKGDARENENRSRDYYKVPSPMKYHKWTANEERFNILLAKNNATDPDDTGYKFYKSVPVHELPNMTDPKHPHKYPCLKIIGKPCPCCERKEQLDDGSKGGENWDRIKPFIPKERVLYYFNPEGTSDILVHECAAKQKGDAAFPQRLMAQATAMSEGNLPIPFASPNEDGRIVKVNTSKDTFNGNEFYAASAVNFFPRRELPADELYDKCLPWNELLNFGTYEEMERVMNGGEPDSYQSAPAQHTEEQRQTEFERACEQSLQKNVPQQQYHAAPASNYQGQQYNARPAAAAEQGFQQSLVGFTSQPANGFQQAPAGFQTSPANGPLSEADFRRDPMTSQPPQRSFPSEQPAPAAGGCPNGLRFGADCDTSRKCCTCAMHDQCARAQ